MADPQDSIDELMRLQVEASRMLCVDQDVDERSSEPSQPASVCEILLALERLILQERDRFARDVEASVRLKRITTEASQIVSAARAQSDLAIVHKLLDRLAEILGNTAAQLQDPTDFEALAEEILRDPVANAAFVENEVRRAIGDEIEHSRHFLTSRQELARGVRNGTLGKVPR